MSIAIRHRKYKLSNLEAKLVFLIKSDNTIKNEALFLNLTESFHRVCETQKFNATVNHCQMLDNYVGLSVTYPSLMCLANLVNSLKGVSSRMAKQSFPNITESDDTAFWVPGYFATSDNTKSLEDYLQECKVAAANGVIS